MKILIITILCLDNVFVMSQQNFTEGGPPCSIDDPLYSEREDGFNITLHPLFQIYNGSTYRDLNAIGLSTLWYECNFTILHLIFDCHVKLDQVSLQVGDYNVVGYLDASPLRQETLPSGNFSGSGAATISATNVDCQFTTRIMPIGSQLTVRSLRIDTLFFDSVKFDFGPGLIIGGSPVDWPLFNENFKENFEQDIAELKPELTEKVRITLNNIIWKFMLQELLCVLFGMCPDRCA